MVLKNMLNMQMMMFLLVLIGFLIRKQNIVDLLTMFLDIDPLLRGIAVIIAGMPAPITTALLSAKYDGDETYATGMIFVTTIVSLITLPIWCVALGLSLIHI